jgi:hypothetical protein
MKLMGIRATADGAVEGVVVNAAHTSGLLFKLTETRRLDPPPVGGTSLRSRSPPDRAELLCPPTGLEPGVRASALRGDLADTQDS